MGKTLAKRKKMSKAILVIDMIEDFVTGKLGSERAKTIIPKIKNLIDRARKRKVPVIYVCDSHLKEDPEIQIWGQHAMKGTQGSRIVEELRPERSDLVLEKRSYDAFHGTKLDQELKKRGIKSLVFTGVTTNICIQNSVADAFFRGYEVVVAEDCVQAPTEEDHKRGLEYMKKIYGAKILSSKEVLG